jgi:KaiC/GvpD/RAD55 family RecA-like ATPase
MKIDRIKTGITGLDDLLEGGFPKGHCLLLSGAPGTGKTIFGMQYLNEGAKSGEKGLYIAFNEDAEDILLQPRVMGWDFQQYIDNGKLKILTIEPKDFSMNNIINEINDGGFERVVLDSLSAVIAHPIALEEIDISFTLKDRLERLAPSPLHETVASRLLVEKIIRSIRKLPCTSIIIAEHFEAGNVGTDSIAEFLVDGVITLQYVMVGIESSRNLMIRKMRATHHSENIHPLEFKAGSGITVQMP